MLFRSGERRRAEEESGGERRRAEGIRGEQRGAEERRGEGSRGEERRAEGSRGRAAGRAVHSWREEPRQVPDRHVAWRSGPAEGGCSPAPAMTAALTRLTVCLVLAVHSV